MWAVPSRQNNVNPDFTLSAPHLGPFGALTSACKGRVRVTRGSAAPLDPALGERRPSSPRWDHEPSYCHHGVWPHAGRVFRSPAEPRLPQIHSTVGDAGD